MPRLRYPPRHIWKSLLMFGAGQGLYSGYFHPDYLFSYDRKLNHYTNEPVLLFSATYYTDTSQSGKPYAYYSGKSRKKSFKIKKVM